MGMTLTNEARRNVIHDENAKYRANMLYVVSITDKTNGMSYNSVTNRKYKPHVTYEVGKIVAAPNYANDIDIECGGGIHYFKRRDNALHYDEEILIKNGYNKNIDQYNHNGTLSRRITSSSNPNGSLTYNFHNSDDGIHDSVDHIKIGETTLFTSGVSIIRKQTKTKTSFTCINSDTKDKSDVHYDYDNDSGKMKSIASNHNDDDITYYSYKNFESNAHLEICKSPETLRAFCYNKNGMWYYNNSNKAIKISYNAGIMQITFFENTYSSNKNYMTIMFDDKNIKTYKNINNKITEYCCQSFIENSKPIEFIKNCKTKYLTLRFVDLTKSNPDINMIDYAIMALNSLGIKSKNDTNKIYIPIKDYTLFEKRKHNTEITVC